MPRWSVPREWVGETVAILASGPSMSRDQAEHVKGKCRVIAVNNQGIDTEVNGKLEPALAPWADVLYAADFKWWDHYRERALKFAGRKVTIRSTVLPDVHFLMQSAQPVFDERPDHIVSGGNSGYQAIHLAVHFGAARIVLLGFDMKLGDNKKRHWFGNHPGRLNTVGNFNGWIHNFAKLAPVLEKKGVQVLNCSPNSALKAFRQARLEDVV